MKNVRILFLHPYPLGKSPSQRFRFEQYFHLLSSEKIRFKSQSFWGKNSWDALYKKHNYATKFLGIIKGIFNRFAILTELNGFDWVFIHRECLPIGPPVFEWMISKIFKKKIIFDFDDAIWLSDEKESWISHLIRHRNKVKFISKVSYKISCGNNYLRNFALNYNKNAFYNPTTIDTQNLHNPRQYQKIENEIITIGWTGSHSTLKYLYRVEKILQEIEKEFAVRVVIISNGKPDLKLKSLLSKEWSIETEIKDLISFDIGIMPLPNDPWAQGKCGFKALQYMALGIPAVVSNVGVNSSIIKNGINGYCCNTDNDWMEALTKLIKDADLRKNIGQKGKQTVVDSYSVTSNRDNFLSLFS